ncbi:cupin domain-containing protein [Alphaproteobacteria bacterium]|nr:cupin domain-containing protein [Alphaproteobacteria bacterium]
MLIKPSFVDKRGSITDLLTHINVDAITLIESEIGAVRANHFHKETTQWTYILSGDVEYCSKDLKEEKIDRKILTKGMIVCALPWVAHAIRSVTYSEILIFTKGPRSGKDYELDTFRLETPLL